MKPFFLSLLFLVAPLAAQPNVLVFLADDLGWADLGCYGSTFHETPHLDQLAAEGLKFTQAYSAASLCSPTRASIMTGKHPVRVNITDWIPGAGDQGREMETPKDIHNLPLTEFTLGEAFKAEGYVTYYAGKWHLGNPDHGPKQQGFDEYVVTALRTVGADGKSRYKRLKPLKGERPHLTQHLTRETIKFLKRQSPEKPFFAFVSYHDVHTGIKPDLRYIAHFKEKAKSLPASPAPVREGNGVSRAAQDNPAYASMVRGMDQSVGDILETLANAKLADNTIVIFTSDNGGLCTKADGGPACNLPLRAGKGWLYEGGIRIPFLIKFPGQVKPASSTDHPLVTTDFYPTFLSLAGLKTRPEQHLDATNLAPLILGAPVDLAPRDLYWHFPHYHGSCWTPGSAMRSDDWKLVEFHETGRHELYNLAEDPGEGTDLAKEHPEKADQLLKKLHDWQKELQAKLPTVRQGEAD